MLHHVMGVDGYYPTLLTLWLLPLAGAIINWAFGPQLKRSAGPLGSAVIFASFVGTVLMWHAATQHSADGAVGAHQALFNWIPGWDFGLLIDPLALLWTLIITGVGFLIHVYSIGYMDGDNAFARFFGYMNFFVFAMLTLVLSDNFVGLLVGWGLVGLASYFLIGFWFFNAVGCRSCAQSLRHQRRRRRRHHVRDLCDLCGGALDHVRRRICVRGFLRDAAALYRFASVSSSVRRRSRRRFRCTPGCPTQWKARHRSRR